LQVNIINQQLSVTVGHKDGGISVENFMHEKLYLPNGYIRKLLSDGCVSIQGRIVQGQEVLKSGQKMWVDGSAISPSETTADSGSALGQQQGQPSILFEDKHILVVDKPANLIVHAPKIEQEDTLDARIARYYADTNQNHRVLHVHRLDKGTTGVLLYGKHGFIARSLDEELRNGIIKRTYIAVTFGRNLPRSGTVCAAIGRDRHQSGKFRVSATGKEAITKYRRISQIVTNAGTFSLVACKLETGRTHQIRVHLGSIGAPIVGDVLYGGRAGSPFDNPGDGIGLHAWYVHFFHPYEEMDIDVHAPLPSTFKQLLVQLGFEVPRMDGGFLPSTSF
jgi:23S rRNA pseudouridine1911/1915/1917 synthase